jgi:DNA repair exonuclease SbcCD ATPase subunit
MWDDKHYSEMVASRDEITHLIEQNTEYDENQSKMIQCMNDIESLTNFISSCSGLFDKFFGKKYFKSTEDIYHLIRNSLSININIQKYVEYTNYINILNGLKEDKKSLEDLIDQYKDFSKNQSIHLNQYQKLKEKLDTLLEKKRELLTKVRLLEDEFSKLGIEIDSLNIIKSSLGLYKQLSEELSKSNELLKDLKSKVDESMRLKQELQVKNGELSKLSMTDMPIVSNRIEKAKYQMILYDQYKKDYDEYNNLNMTLQKVLFYSSTKGIQSVYIEAFMNSMLQLTNQLLGLLFNGRFMIKQFIVKENEFSIPCIDASGQERDDIAEMSDSQLSMISMIISFVILHKASEYYNIIKLDEVDANLDNTNRLQFAVLINKIIDILNFHQCIIISHNNEIDLSQADMAIFKIEKEEELRYLLNSGANVIFNYNSGV